MCVCVDEAVEFPDCVTIRRRTAAFQQRFVEHFLTLYSSLTASVQTSALSVAVRRRSSPTITHLQTSSSAATSSPDIVVSLNQYLGAVASCTDIPFQLPASDYALTVSPDHFDLVRRARIDGCVDAAGLARLVVAGVAAESATELARAFEYQLVLLGDEQGLAARLGAKRAAERAMEYLRRSSRHVDVNSLMRGVIEGRPMDAPPTVSAIINRRCELHWNIDDMFLCPGLRRERLLVAGAVDVLGGYGTPWRLYASTDGTDATLYGYRGQLLARDFHSEWLRGGRSPLYHLDASEEAAYDIEVPLRSDDFHRTYRPYRRLIGSAVMASYSALPDEDKLTVNLDEFVQRLQGDAFRRDEVEPVFRPLTAGFCGEEFTPGVTNPISNSKASLNFTALTSREFCYEESAPASNSMPENSTPMYDQFSKWAAESCQECVPTPSSTLRNISAISGSPVYDRARMDEVPVDLTKSLTSNGLRSEVSVSRTNSATNARDQNTFDVDQGRASTSTDQPVMCSTTTRRRPPPPVVKPKPSLELRRRMSATVAATTVGGSQTTTSLPVTERQSSVPADGSDLNPEVTVRFPTLDELFGRELAAIRRASTHLPGSADTDTSRPAALQHTGSSINTSPSAISDVIASNNLSQPASTLLTSDI